MSLDDFTAQLNMADDDEPAAAPASGPPSVNDIPEEIRAGMPPEELERMTKKLAEMPATEAADFKKNMLA